MILNKKIIIYFLSVGTVIFPEQGMGQGKPATDECKDAFQTGKELIFQLESNLNLSDSELSKNKETLTTPCKPIKIETEEESILIKSNENSEHPEICTYKIPDHSDSFEKKDLSIVLDPLSENLTAYYLDTVGQETGLPVRPESGPDAENGSSGEKLFYIEGTTGDDKTITVLPPTEEECLNTLKKLETRLEELKEAMPTQDHLEESDLEESDLPED